jgi:hypothetical protein
MLHSLHWPAANRSTSAKEGVLLPPQLLLLSSSRLLTYESRLQTHCHGTFAPAPLAAKGWIEGVVVCWPVAVIASGTKGISSLQQMQHGKHALCNEGFVV